MIDASHWKKLGIEELEKTMKLLKERNTNVAKNIIIFVGDGMSLQTVTGTIFDALLNQPFYLILSVY
jgi:alkaline phosphatase